MIYQLDELLPNSYRTITEVPNTRTLTGTECQNIYRHMYQIFECEKHMKFEIIHNAPKPPAKAREGKSIYPWDELKPGSAFRVDKRSGWTLYQTYQNLKAAARGRMKRYPGEEYTIYEDEAAKQVVAYRER